MVGQLLQREQDTDHNVVALLVILALALFCSCSTSDGPTRKELTGTWEATSCVIETRSGEREFFNVRDYGYGRITFAPDSTYETKIAVLKDINVKRQIFGINAGTTLMQAEYHSYQSGTYAVPDSLVLYSAVDSSVVISANLAFSDGSILLSFTDNNGYLWKTRWRSVE